MGQIDVTNTILFLAHAIACKKLAEQSNKTPMEIAIELNGTARSMLGDDSVSPQDLEKFMQSIMPELGVDFESDYRLGSASMSDSYISNYILEGKNPVPCKDIEKWAYWMEKIENKRVALTDSDGLAISTVFLGINHSGSDEMPILFETMVFDSDEKTIDNYCRRYHSWEEAESGHWEIVALISGAKQ